MEPVKPSTAMTPRKKLARSFAKVLHVKALIGIASVDGLKNVVISDANLKDEGNKNNIGDKSKTTTLNWSESFNEDDDDEELQEKVANEALLAKLFASISTVKAAYAELQYAQSPFDPDGIQAADQLLVSELKTLSELKQCYLKKQFDPSPETAILVAESKELQGVIKTYEIMGKKLESQARLKDSEIIFLREKLDEANKHNKAIEKRLNQSGQLSSMLENLHISGLSPSHFITVLRHTVRSTRSFVRQIVDEMRSAGWDIDAAADAVKPGVAYMAEEHKCFAIEAFVCREMFDAFHIPGFSLSSESTIDGNKRQQWFFGKFNELKSMKAKEYLTEKPRSSFAKFCRVKYLRLVHPKMEASFFGNMSHRNMVNAGGFGQEETDTAFFTSFAEMAKRVWLLHCLAFSYEPQASIFQVGKGCRFSDVYMESVNDEIFLYSEEESADPQVAFTVVPGFRIGKTVIQCQVYLSQHHHQTKVKRKTTSSTKPR